MEHTDSKGSESLVDMKADVDQPVTVVDIVNPRTALQNLDLPRTKAASSSAGNIVFPIDLKILDTNALLENAVDTTPKYTTKPANLIAVHRPRQMSRSTEISEANDIRDQTTPLRYAAMHGGSPLVRSRSTYSINMNVFAFAEAKIKAANSASSFDLIKDVNRSATSSESGKVENKGIPDSQLEDGFLREIELKGFAGIWGHPVTRYEFLHVECIS
jgi:hypothetical protein